MPTINYNIESLFNDRPSSYRFITDTPVTDQAYYANHQVDDYSASYGFQDWINDASSVFYRDIQTGEINEAEDVMTAARNNIRNAKRLLELYDYMSNAGKEESVNYGEQIDDLDTQFLDAVKNLRMSGVWSEDRDPNQDDLQGLIDQQDREYQKAYDNYLHNLEQYNSSMKAYDVSQYFTRKSNQAVLGWGNFFFKLPSTMGTSNTSPFLQLSSMAAGYAGAQAGMEVGASIGAVGGPVGAGIGAVVGSVAGAMLTSQTFGGMQAREYESHMEAFNAQVEKVYQLAEKNKINLDEVTDNIKDQLEQKGIDTSYMDQRMLIEAGISQGLDSGVQAFNDAAEDAFKGSRRVYEINNALGFGEAVSDLAYVLPLGRWIGNAAKGSLKLLAKPLASNKIANFFEKRFQTGVEISKMGTLLRNKEIKKTLTDLAIGAATQSATEATEEGAQKMIVDEYMRGEYDEQYANGNFFQALSEGQVFKDLGSNIWRRMKAAGAVLNLNPEYKDDQQMFEEMLFGALLPFTSPQGIIGNAGKIHSTYKKISTSKEVGDYLANALSIQDEINRSKEFYRLQREGNPGGKTYSELLDSARELVKSKSPQGKGKFKLDSTVLTEDGSVPTDEQIDEFFDQQQKEAKFLQNVKEQSKKQIKKTNFEEPEDEDTYLAIKASVVRDMQDILEDYGLNAMSMSLSQIKLAESDRFIKSLQAAGVARLNPIINKLLSDDKEEILKDSNVKRLLSQLTMLSMLNEQLAHYDQVRQLQSAESRMKRQYAALKLISDRALEDDLDNMSSYTEAAKEVTEKRKELIEKIQSTLDDVYKTSNVFTQPTNNGIEETTDREAEAIDLRYVLHDYAPNSVEDYALNDEYTQQSRLLMNRLALRKHLEHKLKNLNEGTPEYLKSVVSKYKQAQKRQQELADENNKAARQHRDPNIPGAVKDDQKVTDMTAEQVEKKKQEYTQSVEQAVTKFKNLIDGIPEDSSLSKIKHKVRRGEAAIEDNPMSYARFVSRVMKRLSDDFDKSMQKEGVDEGTKKTYSDLKQVADNLGKQVDKLREFNAENAARAKRFNLGLPSNSTVWFDKDGKRYMFDTSDFEYSENEGVVVKMLPDTEKEDVVLRTEIERAEKELEWLKEQSKQRYVEASQNETDDLSEVEALDQSIKNVEDTIATLKNKMKSDKKVITTQDDPFLQTLTSKNNLGHEIAFSDLLESYKKKAQIKIENNRQNRKKQAEYELDGDVYEFDVNNSKENRKNSPAYRQQQIEDSPGRTVFVKAYPLNSTFGAKQASKLTNPFHAAKFWRGFITMPYIDSDHAKKYFKTGSDDYGVVFKFGKSYSRYKAIDNFNKIGKQIAYVLDHDKATSKELYELLEALAKGEKNEIKIGTAKLSKEDYDNIIYALPLITNMYQQHTGNQVTVLNIADFVSTNRTTKPNQAELDSRIELINNLLMSFKEQQSEEVDVQGDGLTQEVAERLFSNRVYFGNDGNTTDAVQLVYGDFDYNTRSEMNPDLIIYQDAEGNQMSAEQMKSFYEDKATQALANADTFVDDLVEMLNSAEMGFSVTKEDLLNDSSGQSKLFQLLIAVAKYGDGVTDLHGTFMPSVSNILGGIKSQQKGIKNPNLGRAKKLLFFFQDNAPDIFLSHRNLQDEERRTPIVRNSISEALNKRWFNGKSSIRFKGKDGETIDFTNTDENIEKLTAIFEKFEKALRDSDNSEEFIQIITSDYVFFIGENENTTKQAESILREYYSNRRFSRLRNATNLVQAMSMGTATPANGQVNYENFNRINTHVQDRIDKVPSLSLVKDENGRYYFSLDQWQKTHVKTKSDEVDQKTEYEQQYEKIDKEFEGYISQVNGITKKDDLLQYVIENRKSIGEDAYAAIVTTGKDKQDKLRSKITLKGAKSIVISAIQQNKDEILNNLQQQYQKQISEELTKAEELNGYTTLPLTFAFGSYDTEDGAAIIRFDRNGNKVRMQYANGTPGAMYLVLPSFLTAARTQIPIKLNPKRFDDKTAKFIASVLKYIQNNKVNLKDFVNTLEIDGFKVETNGSFQSLLDTLIYTGTQAYMNNPSDHNLERLLYIDKNGKVIFGDNTLDDTNFDELVKFIQEKKTFRVDRMKAGNFDATVDSSLKIETTKDSEFGEGTILDVAEGTNYVSFIVDNGILLTDLSQSKTSNLVTKPSIYINYKKKRSFSTVPNDPNSANSAASGKQKLKETYEEASREEIEEQIASSENQAVKQISDFFKDLFGKIVAEYSAGNIKFTNLRIGTYGHKSNRLGKTTYDGTIDSSEEGLQFSIDDPEANRELLVRITKAAAEGKNVSIVVMDEAGNFIEIGGKKFHHIPSIKLKSSVSDRGDAKSNSSLNSVDNLVDVLAQAIAKALNINSQSASTDTATPVQPQTPKVQPSGYVGLNDKPKTPVQVVDDSQNKTTFTDDGNGKFTFTANGTSMTWNRTDNKDDVDDMFYEKFGDEQEVVPDDIQKAYEEAYQKSLEEKPLTEGTTDTTDGKNKTNTGAKGTLGKKFAPPTPGTKFENNDLSSVSLPKTYDELKNSLQSVKEAKAIFDKIEQMVNDGVSYKDFMRQLSTLYLKYLKTNIKGLSEETALGYLSKKDNQDLIKRIAINLADRNPAANLASIFDFLSKHVQKEDFNKALKRAEKILGKGFDLSFLTTIDKRYDMTRQAMVYVFGQCASSGIRIFRDASTNKIARGSLYHEAFHKVSLFILSKEERAKMYEDARNAYEELEDATDQQVEEFLADRFAEFVLDAELREQGKYYSSNPVFKFFQKMFDPIRNIINRLTKANITPEYVDMNKLFKDMYSGRYAYAKATSKNIEMFEKVYSGFTPFAGFKVDDVEIAEDAQQYQNILRDLVARFIRLTDLLYVKDGLIKFNSYTLKQDLQSDLDAYTNSLRNLKRNRDKIMKQFSQDDIDEALVTMYTLMQTYKRILQDDVWDKWSAILSDFVQTQFNIQKSDDPQDISDDVIPNTSLDLDDIDNEIADDEFDTNTSGSEVQSAMSNKRDSYMTDMFKASHPSMKLLLWSISQFDPNDSSSGKFTPEGLIKYSDVRKVYRDVVQAISGSKNVEDMLDKLKTAAARSVEEFNDYSLTQLHAILSDEDVPQAIRNRFFSDFVRNINNFDNHVYESEDVAVGKTAAGKPITEPRYTASVRSGNTDMVTEKLSFVWKSGIAQALNALAGKTGKQLSDIYKNVLLKVNSAGQDISKIIDALKLIQRTYGFGNNGDVSDDATIIQRLSKKNNNLLVSMIAPFARLKQADVSTSDGISKFIEHLFSEKGPLTNISELFGANRKPSPKTDSIRGPKGNKIYSISAYNFITRLFDTRVKDAEWRNRMKLNPYCQHSVWLKAILNDSITKVRIKLGTVLDNNYGDSVADVSVTKLEDLLNRFVSVMSGRHLIPSLANKRFAADIDGIQTFKDLFSTANDINKGMVDRFVGYLADEILAISDAMYVRDNFITKLNEITNSNYTVKSFSALTPTQQEEIFKNNTSLTQLLGTLVKQYHYTSSKYEYVLDETNGRIAKRVFHIDLTKGSGYNFRHFKSLQDFLKLSDSQVQSMSSKVFTNESREDSAKIAYDIANGYRSTVIESMNRNILATIDRFIELGIITGNRPSIENMSIDIPSLKNRYLPSNLILNWDGNLKHNKKNHTADDIYKAIGYFTIIGMSDAIEFEKIVSGDIGFHKNITSVNKRYSGITSTIQITSEKGVVRNAFDREDRLYDSTTFNSVTFNTSSVIGVQKFKSDMKNVLGADVVESIDFENTPNGKGELIITYNKSELIQDGKLTDKAKNSPLISRYIANKRVVNGKTLTDEQLLDQAIADAENRFRGFLDNDPTDASVFITAEMYRQLRQREGNWNDVDEACYNLLENYDNIIRLSKSYENELRTMCQHLGIKYEDLIKKAKDYENALKSSDQKLKSKAIEEYKGFIISATQQLQATSLKYVYYGEPADRSDKLYVPTYDKMSLSPIFKIFSDEHEMYELYDFMKKNHVDMAKIESAVKSGGIPSFELFDQNGRMDRKAMEASVIQHQYFELIGKQLNTDAHEMHSTALLTQFMKIAMMNIQDSDVYDVGGTKVFGSVMKTVYNKILDHFTSKGLQRFKEEFGIEPSGINKTKLMKKLQRMAVTQGLPADTINSFKTIAGEFILHPAGIPNMKWIQSRILSEMGKKVIDTLAPGQALYQVSSVGYDNIFNLKTHPDKHLLMPGENGSTHMQVKLSILFFKDIIEEANKQGLKLDTFDKQRKFILENQELFALSYRVPTQGQNSTLPIQIVDVFPPQRGAIVSFPAGITALTGSDFDIDKMFLARPNFTIDKKTGKLRKVTYNMPNIIASKDLSSINDDQLQNALLDMYQAILTSKEHYLASNTPLDVCTAPVKDFINNEVRREKKKTGYDFESIDGYYSNPIFQTDQKLKNAASDGGIGPMALNSVFRFFIQQSGLTVRKNEILQQLGLDNMNRIYDNSGEDILDLTSALINAFVDAVKDSYIGDANVNGFTYDVTSFLITSGFGHDTFAFLTQPIIVELANKYNLYKNGKIGVTQDEKRGKAYLQEVEEHWVSKNDGKTTTDLATPEQLSREFMMKASTRNDPEMQLKYLNTFLFLKDLAQGYRDAIRCAQIDTKKYGITVDDLISFIQAKQQFTSEYNLTFSNPQELFDNTFLGEKYNKGLEQLFNTFGDVLLEFSPIYVNTANKLSKQYSKYGRYSKKFLKVVGPKIKAVIFSKFFNQYLVEHYNSTKPLRNLVEGINSVPGRFSDIKRKCMQTGEGYSLFEVLKLQTLTPNKPGFFYVDRVVNDDAFVKSNVQAAISEMFNSEDEEIRQWISDFAVYMFYLTGANDANAGGLTKTTLYDLLPPQHIANIKAGDLTFNEFIQNELKGGDKSLTQSEMDQVMRLVALTDDSIINKYDSRYDRNQIFVQYVGITGRNQKDDIIVLKKGSYRFYNSDRDQYDRFIKVWNTKYNKYDIYQLGNIAESVDKQGRVWANPIYFKIDSLGYRNSINAALSVRTDGYVSNDGKVVSLLNNTDSSGKTNYFDLDEKTQYRINITLGNSSKVYQLDEYHSSAVFKDIYDSDVVFYINDSQPTDASNMYKNYAEFLGKEFYIISPQDSEEQIPNIGNKKYTIISPKTVSDRENLERLNTDAAKRINFINANGNFIYNSKEETAEQNNQQEVSNEKQSSLLEGMSEEDKASVQRQKEKQDEHCKK